MLLLLPLALLPIRPCIHCSWRRAVKPSTKVKDQPKV
jgi:hypothetical protein